MLIRHRLRSFIAAALAATLPALIDERPGASR
jgi:hypothetical protein